MARSVDIKPFDELTRDELYRILELRNLVFVVGQEITAVPEIDGRDPDCEHAMLWRDGRLLATARIAVDDSSRKVGRVAVHPDFQRQGLGTELMRAIQDHLGSRTAKLHAQAYLEEWYLDLGWKRVGEPFEEAGIEHVEMRWSGR
ncbi:MAG: GNAT family N-acetyltransferase [Persicimonas sp.]